MKQWLRKFLKLDTYNPRTPENIRWCLILITTYLIVGTFFDKQGYVSIETTDARAIMHVIFMALYLFVIFRQLRPAGVQDLQGLVLLTFCYRFQTDSIGMVGDESIFQFLLGIVLLGRWLPITRMLGMLPLLMMTFHYLYFPWQMCITCHSACFYRDGARLVAESEGIYKLYDYPHTAPFGTHVLYREIEFLPGVKLIKRLRQYAPGEIAPRMLTPDNTWIFVDPPPQLNQIAKPGK